MTTEELIKALREKQSRDNRKLLDEAADQLELAQNGLIALTERCRMLEGEGGEAIRKDYDEWWGEVFECSICSAEFMLDRATRLAEWCPCCGSKLEEVKEGQK